MIDTMQIAQARALLIADITGVSCTVVDRLLDVLTDDQFPCRDVEQDRFDGRDHNDQEQWR